MQLDYSFFIPYITNYSCHLFSIGFQANFGVADQLGYRKLIFLPCNCVVPEIWRWDSAARDKWNWRLQGGAPPETEPKTFWLASGCTA